MSCPREEDTGWLCSCGMWNDDYDWYCEGCGAEPAWGVDDAANAEDFDSEEDEWDSDWE